MIELKHLDADCGPESIVDEVQAAGGVIVDGARSGDVMDELAREIAPYLEAASGGKDSFLGRETRRVGALIARSATSRDLALDEVVNAACSEYLSPYCDGHQLHLTQAVAIGPGEGAQGLHRDRGVWGYHVPRPIETQFSTIWALTDFTAANGATRVVPGSHLWEDGRKARDEEIVFAEMERGSVLIYSGSVLHGGGTNETEQDRIGVLLHYAPNWLRQEENQYMSCPPHVAKDLSPEIRALIGYTNHYAMGFCTPPFPPGEGREQISPESLFKHPSKLWPGL